MKEYRFQLVNSGEKEDYREWFHIDVIEAAIEAFGVHILFEYDETDFEFIIGAKDWEDVGKYKMENDSDFSFSIKDPYYEELIRESIDYGHVGYELYDYCSSKFVKNGFIALLE